jgi:hypothetical protein
MLEVSVEVHLLVRDKTYQLKMGLGSKGLSTRAFAQVGSCPKSEGEIEGSKCGYSGGIAEFAGRKSHSPAYCGIYWPIWCPGHGATCCGAGNASNAQLFASSAAGNASGDKILFLDGGYCFRVLKSSIPHSSPKLPSPSPLTLSYPALPSSWLMSCL